MAEQDSKASITVHIDEEALASRIKVDLDRFAATITAEMRSCFDADAAARQLVATREANRTARSQSTTPTVSGSFNQRSRQGKLLAWTIFSPTRLAILCLDALGEHIGQLDFPDDAPPLVWHDKPATEALQELASMYGRHIVRMPTGCLSVCREG